MKPLHQIVYGPLVTEKAATAKEGENTYVFKVSVDANKIEIGRAITAMYGVKVKSVRTAVVRGDAKRFGRHIGIQNRWKKAYVRVDGDQVINTYEPPPFSG